MTSCDLFGSELQNVYGPPPDYSSESSESSYNPQDDDIQSEYEAPIAYESRTTTEETTEPATDEYDPIRDEPSVVYGPPSYLE